MQIKTLLWVAMTWILSQASVSLGKPTSICKILRDGISCPTLTPKEQKSVNRLCKEDKISLVCGNSKCKRPKNDLNCPCDCRRGMDHTITEVKTGSYNGRTFCPDIQTVRHPKNESEIVTFLKEARAQNLPVKAIGASHTDNASICTSGMVIATNGMKKIFGTTLKPDNTRVVRAQSGVTIGELGRWLHERHFVTGYAIVGYHLVTLAGILGTGAHGSSPKHSSLLSDAVYTIRMVLADGSIKEFSRDTTGKTDPDLWNALRVNLGMFGIISEVEIEIQEDFLVQMETRAHLDDPLYVDATNSIWPLVQKCDVASVSYFPPRKASHFFEKNHRGKAIVNCGMSLHKTPEESWKNFSARADPGAQFVLHAPKRWNMFWNIYLDRLHKSSCNNTYACKMESLRRRQLVDQAPYARFKSPTKQNLVHRAAGITGFAHSMQNSNGSEKGAQFRQTDWAVAVPFRHWGKAFRVLRDYFAETQSDGTPKFCLPLMGVYIRFSRVSDAWMSHASAGGAFQLGEPVMFMEIPQFIPSYDIQTLEEQSLAAEILTQYESRYRGFVELMLEQVEARVHWAKNRPDLFHRQHEVNSVRKAQFAAFNQQILKLDPTGVFSNDFMHGLGISYPSTTLPSNTEPPEKVREKVLERKSRVLPQRPQAQSKTRKIQVREAWGE